ncbi:hypothetical protein D3C81_1120750 [compost metagenome]
MSEAVENVSDFLVGIVVFASINLVITPPIVSIPNESGVTSNNNTSFTSPVNTPPWIAAPKATTSSGFTPLEGSFPKNAFTASTIAGIRVEPPTKIISSISDLLKPAFFNADSQGAIVLLIKSAAKASNLARDNERTKCFGPVASAVIYGKLISVEVALDNSILAFSAASFKRCNAIGSFFRSKPLFSFLNSSFNQLMITLSKSSPPK